MHNRFEGHAGIIVQAGEIRGSVHLGGPVVADPVVPRQLPAATARFVGRAAQLARLDEVLLSAQDGPGTVVVSGTAGVGKTAVVVRWAHASVEAFPDGQLYVDLRGYGPEPPLEPLEVLAGFLRALGAAHPESGTALAERAALFRTAVSARRMLVVLDNAYSEEQVRPLLPGAASCAVIVVSRRQLSGLVVHHGAESLDVDRLSPTEAVEVLDAAMGARTDTDPATTAVLARRCARLPLALRIVAELAASRPQVSLAELAAELDDEQARLDLLETGEDPRSAVRAVFSWSYTQLTLEVADAFRALGTHPGNSVGVHTVAALTGTELRSARRLLIALARAQLVFEPVAGRFEMHDLLRDYARELATTVDDEEARQARTRRAFDHYLHTADRADRVITTHRFRIPLDGEASAGPSFDNRSAALDWLTAERHNLVAMCRLDDPRLDSRRWQLAYTLRGFFFLTKRWGDWTETHILALAAAERAGDRHARARAHNDLGRALLESARRDEAAVHYERARLLFEEVGDRHGRSNALANQAAILRHQGHYEEALRHNHEALDHYRHAGARRNTAITLRSIALSELELGRFEAAAAHTEEALAVLTALEIQVEAAKGFSTLALIHHRAGRPHEAREAGTEAVRLSRRCGSRYEEARALHRLGAIAGAEGHDEEARAHWSAALALYRSLGSRKADTVAADLAGGEAGTR
ncbi:tetratricopeptide repeat protein [Streptomyces sp. NBC_01142]|uniref:ATP-binding protein n=1 Tax=Streptomyces sp. NBC_01142 TaxID=2975865 RepID=UPI0022526FEB|nr:tetratricopeptide repeat protein [Streptomyces sp. NBC_01142]MCX4825049.1 tetratricopeptide repeat protein [Streptomyces sp. NBC_01142]